MTVDKSFTFERVTLLSNTNGDSQPALAALSNGGFVSMLTHGGAHLDGDIFSPDGVSKANLDQLLGTGGAVDQLADGNIVVASLSGGDIFHTIRNGTTGAQITASEAIGAGKDPQNLAVTALTGGRFAIAYDAQPGSSSNVYMAVFNSDGSAAWSDGIAISGDEEMDPALAGLSNGNLAFAYESDDLSIFVGVLDADGKVVKNHSPLGSGFDSEGTINRNVSMTATGHGFAIVYEDNEWDGGNDITLARFALDGALIGKTRINNPDFNYTNPSITMLSNGMLAVTATFANGDTDMEVMLVDASNGTTLASSPLSAGQDIFDFVDRSTVAGVGQGRVAVQWTNVTDKTVNGELLDVTVVSIGDGDDDLIVADHLKDVIDGGGGNDTVSYVNSDGPVTVTINGKGSGFHATNDTLKNVENLIGSAFDDFLFGDSGANRIEGGNGKDVINGGGGTDQLDGGGDNDLFVFTDNLVGPGSIKGGADSDAILVSGGAGIYSIDLTDALIDSIEVLTFGAVADGGTGEVQLVASQFGTGIAANASVVFSGNPSGIETVRIFMEGAPALDLSKLAISGQDAGDGFVVEGGDAGETITGSAIGDLINGGDGDDILDGGTGGADTINGGKGNDTIYGGTGTDTIDAGEGDDTIISRDGESIDNVAGGAGVDRYVFDDKSFGITVDLVAGTATDFVTRSVSGIENVDGTFVDDTIKGDGQVNVLRGRDGADKLFGLAGADTLDGGAGIDEMHGGADSDTYFVDTNSDVIVEGADEGAADHVRAAVSYTLQEGVFVEFLSTTNEKGTGAINLFGNTLKQTITGNAGANLLYDGGKGKADVLRGLGGSDTYLVFNSGTTIVEGAAEGSNDTVRTNASFDLLENVFVENLLTTDDKGSAAINLYGNTLKQTITGNAGKNLISDGGKGAADVLVGLGGDDTYRVYNTKTVIVEGATQGTNDTVLTNVSFDLLEGVHIETFGALNQASTAALNLYGNTLKQTTTGNAGKNLISDGGKGAADVLVGLGGDDTYRVYNSGTVVTETSTGGALDTVQAAVSYTLKAGVHVEALRAIDTTAKSALSLFGNELGQTITGNAGANSLRGYDGDDTINGGAGDDRISGGNGNDTLAGNTGADTYFFSNALNAATNVDTIKGFSGIDLISLNSAIFTKAGPVGALAASAFVSNANGQAFDASDRIIYETDTGILRYDPDGTGAGAAIAFAIMDGLPSMNAGDFVIA